MLFLIFSTKILINLKPRRSKTEKMNENLTGEAGTEHSRGPAEENRTCGRAAQRYEMGLRLALALPCVKPCAKPCAGGCERCLGRRNLERSVSYCTQRRAERLTSRDGRSRQREQQFAPPKAPACTTLSANLLRPPTHAVQPARAVARLRISPACSRADLCRHTQNSSQNKKRLVAGLVRARPHAMPARLRSPQPADATTRASPSDQSHPYSHFQDRPPDRYTAVSAGTLARLFGAGGLFPHSADQDDSSIPDSATGDVVLVPEGGDAADGVRVLRAVAAVCAPGLRPALENGGRTGLVEVAVAGLRGRSLALFAAVLHGRFGGLGGAGTRDVWEVRGACVRYAVAEAALGVVEAELGRREDLVEVDDVFRLIASWAVDADSEEVDAWERARVIAARRCIRSKFVELSQGEEWTRLDPAVVERVLRMNDLVLPAGELDVFRAVLRWARDPANSHADALRLLRLVRFPTILDRDLLAAVRCQDFSGDDVFYRMVLEAFVRRAEVRLVHGPRNAARVASGPHAKYGSAVSETLLIHRRSPAAPVSHARLNARAVRTAAFKGVFPLPLYRHMRFRPRSPGALLFTAVIPNWSTSTTRIRTESRSFLDHRWSVWIDPFVNADGSTAPAPAEMPASPATQRQQAGAGENQEFDDDGVGSTTPSIAHPIAPAPSAPPLYMSMFLCCQSDLGGNDRFVDVTVDYSLFIASAADPFVMERKVCAAKSFSVHGQASGFRLHTRRSLVTDPAAGLYNAEADELVIGAHIVSLDAANLGAAEDPDVLVTPVDLQQQQQQFQAHHERRAQQQCENLSQQHLYSSAVTTETGRSPPLVPRRPSASTLVGSASRSFHLSDKSPPSAGRVRRSTSATVSPVGTRLGRGDSTFPSRLSLGGGQTGSTMSISFGQSLLGTYDSVDTSGME
jgi:BTB And C-terminal Kelch